MKRIVFIVKHRPGPGTRISFAVRMRVHGVKVAYEKAGSDIKYKKDNLYVTDDNCAYERIVAQGGKAIAVTDENGAQGAMTKAEYTCTDVYEAEYKYFDEVWHRFNDLPMEILRTKRLILRETTEADVDYFYEMYKDPKLTEFTEDLYDDPEEEKEYVRQYREKVYKVSIYGIYTVIRKKDKRVIGRVGTTVRQGFDEIEVGFVIGTDYQQQGYAYEAMKAVLERMDGFGETKRFALVMPGNVSSQKLLMKLSFAMERETTVDGIEYQVWKD
ncbi:MAG: GNAT family N-acetyltransferase [Lachnospiraceae bacterium]|nr:GNAT family N-acetyltransferase [Lachnospiraceae bacterium]